MTDKIKVLDLFAGVGGISLGLERTGGFETTAFCEIEQFQRKILAKHWPEVPCYEDVTKLTGDILKRDGISVDGIVGGFPCQDISFTGRGAGLAGERSGLWFEFARLIGEIRPRFVIVENVPALIVRGLDAVLLSLAKLGYDAEWHIISASSLGADHQRKRLWIIAYPNEGTLRPRWELGVQKVTPFNRPRLVHSGGGREPYGVPDWLDRVGACGNAVVPQIPEMIGNAILESINQPTQKG